MGCLDLPVDGLDIVVFEPGQRRDMNSWWICSCRLACLDCDGSHDGLVK